MEELLKQKLKWAERAKDDLIQERAIYIAQQNVYLDMYNQQIALIEELLAECEQTPTQNEINLAAYNPKDFKVD